MRRTAYFSAMMLILLSSCAAYSPQSVDIPLIRERGDMRIDVGGFVATKPQSEGAMLGGHATLSYGASDFVAIQTYASFDFAGRFHIQFAPGLFRAFENNTVIEWYNGLGLGWAFWDENFYQLAFSQFNIGRVSNDFEYGFGLKGGYIFANDHHLLHKDRVVHQESGWMIEPSAMIRFGGERVRFKTQINYLWTRTISDAFYIPFSMSVGVNINISLQTARNPRITNFE